MPVILLLPGSDLHDPQQLGLLLTHYMHWEESSIRDFFESCEDVPAFLRPNLQLFRGRLRYEHLQHPPAPVLCRMLSKAISRKAAKPQNKNAKNSLVGNTDADRNGVYR